MTDETARKEDLTLDQLVHTMQNAWTRFRDAQLHAFCAAARVLIWARENEADFCTYCKRNSVSGQELENLVVELMVLADPDSEDSEGKPTLSGERRAEYGNCVGWFADRELCPERDPDKAVALARQKGRITGIAREYRDKKDAVTPKLKTAKEKARATRVRRTEGAASTATASKIIAGSTSATHAEVGDRPVFLTLHDRPASEANSPVPEEAGGAHEATKLLALLARKGVGEARNTEDREGPEIRIMLDIRDETGVSHLFGPIFDDGMAVHLAYVLADQLAGREAAAA